jgi:glycosidase
LLTTRGIPNLYYGDEIAMTGPDEPTTRQDFPGGWPGDPRNAFNAAGRTAEQQEVFAHLQKLLKLRQQLEPLRRGALKNLRVTDQQYVYARAAKNQTVIIAINNDAQPATVSFNAAPAGLKDGATLTDQLGVSSDARMENGVVNIALPPRAASIFTAR